MSSFLLLLLLMLPAPEEKGSLLIQTAPGTEVIWDGVSLAKTDQKGRLNIEEIPLGQYTLSLRKDGFRRLRREVDVRGGQVFLVLPLEPLTTSNRQQASHKPSKTLKPPEPPKPEQAKTESGQKKAVLPPEFKVKEKGDVPVWPTSPQPDTPARETKDYLFFWLLLFILAAVLALTATMRRRPKAHRPQRGSTILPAGLEEEAFAMNEAMDDPFSLGILYKRMK